MRLVVQRVYTDRGTLKRGACIVLIALIYQPPTKYPIPQYYDIIYLHLSLCNYGIHTWQSRDTATSLYDTFSQGFS